MLTLDTILPTPKQMWATSTFSELPKEIRKIKETKRLYINAAVCCGIRSKGLCLMVESTNMECRCMSNIILYYFILHVYLNNSVSIGYYSSEGYTLQNEYDTGTVLYFRYIIEITFCNIYIGLTFQCNLATERICVINIYFICPSELYRPSTNLPFNQALQFTL